MKSVEFCYWLQGMFEINPPSNGLTKEQVSIIEKHLGLVFYHEIDNSYPSEQLDALNKFHNEVKQSEPVVTPSNLSDIDVIPNNKPPYPPFTDPLVRC